jgi:hypothetical protein
MPNLSCYKIEVRRALRRWKRQIYSTTDLRIYSMSLREEVVASANAPVFCKDSWKDLEAFDAQHGWVSRDVFLADAKTRLANGEHVYTLAENGRLVHYGWAVGPVERRYIPDVDQFAEFPADSVYVYDFFTHPECRNRGIYQHSLRQILRELGASLTFEQAFIGVESANSPSRRAIEKIGFIYRFSLFHRWRLFRVQRWLVKAPSHDEGLRSNSSARNAASFELKI